MTDGVATGIAALPPVFLLSGIASLLNVSNTPLPTIPEHPTPPASPGDFAAATWLPGWPPPRMSCARCTAKGIGELGATGFAAAVAVFDATGRQVRSLPITAEHLVA